MGPNVPVDAQLQLCGRSDSYKFIPLSLRLLKLLAVEYLWLAENARPSSKIGISPEVIEVDNREGVNKGDGGVNVERATRADDDGGKREAE